MGKIKNKEGSQTRFLEGEVRRLKKVIRSLEAQVRSLKKHEHMYEVSQDDSDVIADTEDTIIKRGIPCDGEDGCGKGIFAEIHIADKVYGKCGTCDRRKRLK